jgi:integrase
MAIRKRCREQGCKSSSSCDHPLWLDVMHNGRRYRMKVDEFAAPRMPPGEHRPVRTKTEAKPWEGRFRQEIRAGINPLAPPQQAIKANTTVRELLAEYQRRYVDVESLRSRKGITGEVNRIAQLIGDRPVRDLERPDVAEDLQRFYAGRTRATVNRYLSRLRSVTYWAIQREYITRSPFGRGGGVKISARLETRRERRVAPEEEQRLLDACPSLNESVVSRRRLDDETVREIRDRLAAGESQKDLCLAFGISSGLCSQIATGKIWNEAIRVGRTEGCELEARLICALDTGMRQGEMLKLQNRHVDWTVNEIQILAANAKSGRSRRIPFDPEGRLGSILKQRSKLGPEAFVFGNWATGEYVGSFKTAWTRLIATAHGVPFKRKGRGKRAAATTSEGLKAVDLHWHDLRHEAASRWYDLGVGLRDIQILLGHSSIAMTERYLNVSSAGLGEALRNKVWGKGAARAPLQIVQGSSRRREIDERSEQESIENLA